MAMARTIRNQAKRILRSAFEIGQRFGFDVLPRHYYSELPDIHQLRTSKEWRLPFSMNGICADPDMQFGFLSSCTIPYCQDFAGLRLLQRACEMNGSDEGFGRIEADFLYSFVRTHRPPNIVQIGCGVSTAICLMAAEAEKYVPHIVCIEPYPTDFLRSAESKGTLRLIKNKLQNIYAEVPPLIAPGDLLFVDSSHTLGPSGEVTRIILEILPRLCPNAWVHFHDIWFPYDYSPKILREDLFFFHETALLMAFLCMNQRYRVEVSLSMLHHADPDKLGKVFPTYSAAAFEQGIQVGGGHYPSSIYLRS